MRIVIHLHPACKPRVAVLLNVLEFCCPLQTMSDLLNDTAHQMSISEVDQP